jgi:hypothetical protein
MIPISICGRCGGYSRYCTCIRAMAGRLEASGIHISVPPQEAINTNPTIKAAFFQH